MEKAGTTVCKRSFNRTLAKSMDVDKNVWIDVIKGNCSEKFLDVNIKALNLDMNFKVKSAIID